MDFKPLIALLAIVNPLAIVPFFIHYTQGFSEKQRRDTVRTAALSSFCVIATCALLGLQILEFFSISLQSFQVGGGLLLLISAMNMLNAQPAEAKSNTHELEEGAEKAASTLSDYWVKRAEQYHPIIDIGAGNLVTIVFQDGFQLETIDEAAERASGKVVDEQVKDTASNIIDEAVRTVKGNDLPNNPNANANGIPSPDEVIRQAKQLQLGQVIQ